MASARRKRSTSKLKGFFLIEENFNKSRDERTVDELIIHKNSLGRAAKSLVLVLIFKTRKHSSMVRTVRS